MDSHDLRFFEAVARLGGMNRAAAELHTVQSNVTARIRALEAELGTALFERHPRGVTLTEAGRRLLPFARRQGALLADARRAVTDDGRPSGTLRIGSLETTAGLRLPPVLAAYAAAWPEVEICLSTGTTAELIAQVAEHRLEGALVCGPANHPELEEEPIYAEELVLVTAASLPDLSAAAGRHGLKLVVFRQGCSYRHKLEAVLARRGIAAAGQLEFGTLDGIIGCVAAGMGITMLPRVVVEAAAAQGRVALHALEPAEARVRTVFIRRRDGLVSSALAAFLELARPAATQVRAAE